MAVSKLDIIFHQFDMRMKTSELRKIKNRETSVNVNDELVCIGKAYTYAKYYSGVEYGDEFVRRSYITSTNRRADLLYGPAEPLVTPETRTVQLYGTRRTFTCSCGGPTHHPTNAPWKVACFRDGSYRILDVPTIITAVYDITNCAMVDDKGNVVYLAQEQLFPRVDMLQRRNMKTVKKLEQWREERDRVESAFKWRRAGGRDDDYWGHSSGDAYDGATTGAADFEAGGEDEVDKNALETSYNASDKLADAVTA